MMCSNETVKYIVTNKFTMQKVTFVQTQYHKVLEHGYPDILLAPGSCSLKNSFG